MNRDLLVQSQPEISANTAFQQEWLAPVGLFMHGYANPTLVDGLTKPHNPGLEYDIFLYWNQRRLDANEAALAAIGRPIDRPVNYWNMDADDTPPPPTGPPYAEGWDDWGPFYIADVRGLLRGRRLHDRDVQQRGVRRALRLEAGDVPRVLLVGRLLGGEPGRPSCTTSSRSSVEASPTPSARTAATTRSSRAVTSPTTSTTGWSSIPRAYVIPFVGGSGGHVSPHEGVQRSDAEANRLVEWLMRQRDRGAADESGRRLAAAQTFPAKSYVVWMNQAQRGLALTTLSAGQDISDRITQLYAPPGAWSHGLLWGADVVEIPRGDRPSTRRRCRSTRSTQLQGGVRGGGPADWYAVTVRGAAEVRAVLDLLRSGVDGEVAEAVVRQRLGRADAGRLPDLPDERGRGRSRPPAQSAGDLLRARPRGQARDHPARRGSEGRHPRQQRRPDRVRQLLVPAADLRAGRGLRLDRQRAELAAERRRRTRWPIFDVIYNTGQNYPSDANATARARLHRLLRAGRRIHRDEPVGEQLRLPEQRRSGAAPGDPRPGSPDGSDGAGGGIARWTNAGAGGPLTGGFPATDNLYLPSNVTWFSSLPTGAVVDGRYLPSVTDMFVAGLWRDRNAAAANAPVIVHGTTEVGSRYLGLATNPFSRGDAEREWPLIGQAALWSNLTDD